jgi:4-amino-4-deoxy-L-arabinose transferase-like glycosyltransferase
VSDNTKSCLTFLGVIAAACLLAWLGGYNFDTRNGYVAVAAMLTLVFAGIAAALVREDTL